MLHCNCLFNYGLIEIILCLTWTRNLKWQINTSSPSLAAINRNALPSSFNFQSYKHPGFWAGSHEKSPTVACTVSKTRRVFLTVQATIGLYQLLRPG